MISSKSFIEWIPHSHFADSKRQNCVSDLLEGRRLCLQCVESRKECWWFWRKWWRLWNDQDYFSLPSILISPREPFGHFGSFQAPNQSERTFSVISVVRLARDPQRQVWQKMTKILKWPRLFQFAADPNQSKRTFRSIRKLSRSQSIRENIFGHFGCVSEEGPAKTRCKDKHMLYLDIIVAYECLVSHM